MTYLKIALLFLILIVFCLSLKRASGGSLDYGDRPGAKYISCYDADTCTFTIPGIDPLIGWEIPVRVRGIDAPEIRGNCQMENEKALQARDVARATLEKAQVIILRNVGRDKYFRILAGVEVDGLDLANLLVESGLVAPWDGESPKPTFCPGEPTNPSGQPEPGGGVQGNPN